MKKKVVAPMVIFILLTVAAIVISNGYFGLQGQSNRLDANPSSAVEMNDLPGVPNIVVESTVETKEAVIENTVSTEE